MRSFSKKNLRGIRQIPPFADGKTYGERLDSPLGFTLTELMIVLMIAGILATVGWEGQKALLNQYRLEGACWTLVSVLRASQQEAIAAGQPYKIQFDVAGRQYSVWGVNTENGLEHVVRQEKLPTAIKFGAAPGVIGPPSDPQGAPETDGITFRDNLIVFKPDGWMGSGAGAVYLTGGPAKGKTRAVTVTVSGRVRSYRWTGGRWE